MSVKTWKKYFTLLHLDGHSGLGGHNFCKYLSLIHQMRAQKVLEWPQMQDMGDSLWIIYTIDLKISLTRQRNLCLYVPDCGVSERRWCHCCSLVRFELRPQVHLFPDLTSEGMLSSGPPYTYMHVHKRLSFNREKQMPSQRTKALFSGIEGLRLEGVVCCTDCTALWGKIVILDYMNKTDLTTIVCALLCTSIYIT